ncbi:hypothetical protein ACIQXQ_01740 [Peribacillus sp. NPDC097198]|uniref:hypothetical protein n=1 Tax=Peribacillus sp. NPDC097198 TaxID=3364397 RepID=UPI0038197EF5
MMILACNDTEDETADDFYFIDADYSGAYNSGEVKVASVITVSPGTYIAKINSSNIISLKVTTVATGQTGADAEGNLVKANVQKVVK